MQDPALSRLRAALNDIVRGKPEVVDLTLVAVLARGHILLEDVPGVGKTTLAQALARGLGCSFKRIQFTSDLLPGDILGVNIFVQQSGAFEFRPGPIFGNIVLADEINRTTPKTQSSLLEAMNEGQVSIDNETRDLPQPFIVVATQNPQEYHGTYPLPESQMDRFMVRLRMGYPAPAVEKQILQGRGGQAPVSSLQAVLDPAQVLALQAQVDAIHVDELIVEYLLQIVSATRRAQGITLGVSTRGALSLQQACRARAFLEGRRYVLPDDVKALARPVLAHRIVMAGDVDPLLRGRDEAERAIAEILDLVPVPV